MVKVYLTKNTDPVYIFREMHPTINILILKDTIFPMNFFFNFLIEFRRKRKNGLSVDFAIVPKQI